MSSFDTCLEMWKREWPLAGFRLEQLDFSEYEKGNPEEDVSEWQPSLDDVKTVFIFGIGLGKGYGKIKDWLHQDPERRAIWIEDNPVEIIRFFHDPTAQPFLEDPQAILYWMDSEEVEGTLMETLYWLAPMMPFQVLATPAYEMRRAELYEKLRYAITYGMIKKNSLVTEYLQFGVPFFRNFYLNLLLWPESLWGNKLFGKFQGVPAIICGAGPSLNKQLPQLKELNDKAVIFAGGSSLNALAKDSITPHFGAGIDPNSTQAVRLEATSQLTVPFLYRSRIHPEALKKVKGPKLYVSGAGGYDISEWFEEKLGLKSDFLDEGYNVVNFCTEIAVRMGCSPIIYIGMDLAFTGNKPYAEGVEESSNEEEGKLFRKDIYGQVTTTSWKWVAESDWLKEFASEHPDRLFLNATEGGLGFQGVENIPFKQVIERYLTQKLGIEQRVDTAVNECKMAGVTPQKIQESLGELHLSLVRSIKLIDNMSEEVKGELDKEHPQDKASSPKMILLESDLQEEPAYEYILDIFHHVFARLLSRESTRLRLNKSGSLTEGEINRKKLEIQQKKLQFLRDVAEANRLLIEFSEGK